MPDRQAVDPEEITLYSGVENLPSALWDDLAALKPEVVCRRTGAFRLEDGYALPFLGVEHLVRPEERTISVPSGARRPGFQAGLVLIGYLLHASDEGLAGRMVTPRELEGGALFFQGPHALNVKPVADRYGRDGKSFLDRAGEWDATRIAGGDAAFRVFALPKVLLAYILHEADDEFPADVTVTVDANTDRHLPLDCIWALVNVVSARLAE